MRPFAPLVFFAAVACGPKRAAGPPPIPPFSPDEIRAGFPVDLQVTFVLVEPDQPPVTSAWHVVEAGPDDVTIRYTMRDAADQPMGEPQQRTHTWAELSAHADFPVEATTWSEAPVTVRAGTFERARTYVVHRVEEGVPTEEHYSFSLAHPGPPLQVLTLRHGEEIRRMELIERVEP